MTLLPLSRAEVLGRKPTFLEKAFAGTLRKATEIIIGQDLVDAVLFGGYPEMLHRKDPKRRRAWARDYVSAIVGRDVQDIAQVEKLDQMPKLVNVLAHHSGQLTNFAQIGGQMGLDDKTTRKYVTILEQVFLVSRVEPWFRNKLKRLVKTPNLHFLDSGLLAEMLGTGAERIANDRSILGQVLETFVFSEVVKQATWLEDNCTLLHYRDKDQDEVDIVAENDSGAVLASKLRQGQQSMLVISKELRKLGGCMRQELQAWSSSLRRGKSHPLWWAPICSSNILSMGMKQIVDS